MTDLTEIGSDNMNWLLLDKLHLYGIQGIAAQDPT